jgi:hypothetical protein
MIRLREQMEKFADRWLSRPGKYLLTDEAMAAFGTKRIMGAAKRFNRWRYASRCKEHERGYRLEAETLLRDNGRRRSHGIALQDGYALDTSGTLPHLEELIQQCEQIVQERGGKTFSGVQQPFLRNLWFPGDDIKCPAVLDFITSSEVLEPVMHYLKTVPVLARTRPGGVRFMESNAALDPGADGPFRESQLYHLDIHDSPLVYVLVAVRDIEPESGPWTFLPDSVSTKACQTMGYGKPGMSYRVKDEVMDQHADPERAIRFACPKGSVLFIDSSRCFHFGSRNAFPPRFQLMYAFTSVCRADFTMCFMQPMPFPEHSSDSRLRRMVLGVL